MADTDYGTFMPGLYKYLSDKETGDTAEPENDPATTAASIALTGPALGALKAGGEALAAPASELVGNQVGALGNIRALLGSNYGADAAEEAAPAVAQAAPDAAVTSGFNKWAPINQGPPSTLQELQDAVKNAPNQQALRMAQGRLNSMIDRLAKKGQQ